jgi:hypothetical protein
MQELNNYIKRQNLRIMGIEEGEELQAKAIHNICNKIIKKFPKYQESFAHSGTGRPPGHQTDLTKIEPPHSILSLKTISTENRERILKAVGEKKQITGKGKFIKITADFSMETLKARRAWSEVF